MYLSVGNLLVSDKLSCVYHVRMARKSLQQHELERYRLKALDLMAKFEGTRAIVTANSKETYRVLSIDPDVVQLGWAMFDLYAAGRNKGKCDLAAHGVVKVGRSLHDRFEHGFSPEENQSLGVLGAVPDRLGNKRTRVFGKVGMLTWVYAVDWMVESIRRVEGGGELISVAVIEMPSHLPTARGMAASNSGAILKLGFCVSSLRQALRDDGIPVELIGVRFWKGQAPKEVTQRRMQQVWGVEYAKEDEYDAIGIGDWFVRRVLGYMPMTPIRMRHVPDGPAISKANIRPFVSRG
jgi:hypothetical protein